MHIPALLLSHRRSCVLFILLGTLCSLSFGQKARMPYDTLYVNDYSHILTTRAYLSTKDNAFGLRSNSSRDLVYKPNNQINWGLGASYRALTLNIGIRMPVVNDNNDIYGKTRFLDAQAHAFTKRTATTLFLQIFSGYHLRSHTRQEVNWPALAERAYRPDVYQFNIGFSSLRITNNNRFSYRAAFNQDAWQKRSQGSWLVGGYASYFTVRGDSSLVPSALSDQFSLEISLRRGNFFDAGPMGGYVFTAVHKENWFATLSGVVGAGVAMQGITYPDEARESEQFQLSGGPGYRLQLRTGIGYNSTKHYVGMSFTQERVGHLLGDQQRFTWNVSNLRFNVVRRFNVRVGFMDRGIRWARKKLPKQLENALPPEPEDEAVPPQGP
jgi:hypothetical protein